MSIPTAIVKVRHNGREITGRDEDRPEWIGIRPWRAIMKAGFLAGGTHWHEVYFPLHFTKSAFHRYPGVYERRSDAYFRRHPIEGWVDREGVSKQQNDAAKIAASRAAHLPNVKTGVTRELSKHAAYRAFQTRVSVVVPVPDYIPKRKRSASGPDIFAELSAVNSTEVDFLTGLVQQSTDEGLRVYARNKSLPVEF